MATFLNILSNSPDFLAHTYHLGYHWREEAAFLHRRQHRLALPDIGLDIPQDVLTTVLVEERSAISRAYSIGTPDSNKVEMLEQNFSILRQAKEFAE